MSPEDNNNNPLQPSTDNNIESTPGLSDPVQGNIDSTIQPASTETPSFDSASVEPAPQTQVSDVFSSSTPGESSELGATTPVAGEVPATEEAPVVGGIASSQSSGKKNSKLVLILSIVAAVLLLGVGTAFAVQHFLGDDSATNQETENVAPVNDGEDVDPLDSIGDEEAVEAAPASEIDIDKTITDEELGYKINATKLVVSPFAVPERYSAAYGDKSVVLVQTTISSEGLYTGAPSASSLRLLDASGESVTSTTILEAEMKAAGYTPAPFAGPSAGESVTGYAAYLVDSDQVSSLTLQYNRLTSTVIGGGETIPAKTFEVKLND